MNGLVTRGLWCTLALLIGVSAGSADELSGGRAAKLTLPKLQGHQPKVDEYYPQPVNRSALVFVRVNITAKGKVQDATVADGGFHDERFAKAALQIAGQLRFAPAKLNGEPVDYYALIPIHFQYFDGSSHTVSGSFREEAGKVEKLLEQKDFAGAHFHAQWMLAEKVQTNHEYAILQTTLADTFARTGNIHRALR